jgi:hypothetical protein
MNLWSEHDQPDLDHLHTKGARHKISRKQFELNDTNAFYVFFSVHTRVDFFYCLPRAHKDLNINAHKHITARTCAGCYYIELEQTNTHTNCSLDAYVNFCHSCLRSTGNAYSTERAHHMICCWWYSRKRLAIIISHVVFTLAIGWNIIFK